MTASLISLADLLEAYRNGLSDKARYNFDSDMRQWNAWRGNEKLEPASPQDVRDFVVHCAEVGFTRGSLSHASISHILTSISGVHREVLGAIDPTKSIIVKSEIKRLRQATGTLQSQAVALRSEHEVPLPSSSPAHRHGIPIPSVARLKGSCDISTARGLRDRVLLGVGQDLGRRSLDLHLFDHSHFTRRPDGQGDAFIQRSKTDQRGEGKTKIISRPTMDDIEVWKEWKRENGAADCDALLSGVDQTGAVGRRLSPSGINYALRRIIVDALIRAHDIAEATAWDIASEASSHSFRVGLAQDGVAANTSVEDIRDQGDWAQDKRVLAYARNLHSTSGAVANLRRLVPLK